MISAVGHEPDVTISDLCGGPAGVHPQQRRGDRRAGSWRSCCGSCGGPAERHGPERPAPPGAGEERRLKALAAKRVLTDPLAYCPGPAAAAGLLCRTATGHRRPGPHWDREARRFAGTGGQAGRHEPPEGAGPGLRHGPDGGGRHCCAAARRCGPATGSSFAWLQAVPGLPGGGSRRRRRRHGKEMTFEENMARLEEIVALLEKGDAPLSRVPVRCSRRGRSWRRPAARSWTRPSSRWCG